MLLVCDHVVFALLLRLSLSCILYDDIPCSLLYGQLGFLWKFYVSDLVGAGKELVVVRCRSRWKGQLGREIRVWEFWINYVVALVGWVGYLDWEKAWGCRNALDLESSSSDVASLR